MGFFRRFVVFALWFLLGHRGVPDNILYQINIEYDVKLSWGACEEKSTAWQNVWRVLLAVIICGNNI